MTSERRPWARALAVAALLALATSLLLPWWTVSYRSDDGLGYRGASVRPFGDAGDYAHRTATVATGLLVAVIVLWLFVRLAAHSERYEPRRHHRDLVALAALTAVAAASLWLWPDDVPSAWGRRAMPGTDGALTEAAMPALGWYVAVVSALLLAAAAWRARPVPTRAAPTAPPG